MKIAAKTRFWKRPFKRPGFLAKGKKTATQVLFSGAWGAHVWARALASTIIWVLAHAPSAVRGMRMCQSGGARCGELQSGSNGHNASERQGASMPVCNTRGACNCDCSSITHAYLCPPKPYTCTGIMRGKNFCAHVTRGITTLATHSTFNTFNTCNN